MNEWEDLRGSQVKESFESLVKRNEDKDINSEANEGTLRSFVINNTIVETDAKLPMFYIKVLQRLKLATFDSARYQTVEKMYYLLMKKLQPAALMKPMNEAVEFDIRLQKNAQNLQRDCTGRP